MLEMPHREDLLKEAQRTIRTWPPNSIIKDEDGKTKPDQTREKWVVFSFRGMLKACLSESDAKIKRNYKKNNKACIYISSCNLSCKTVFKIK